LKLRALIVDDERPARSKIRHFLELDSDIELIGECENGKDALRVLRNEPVDLLFLDIQMPMMNGFQLLNRAGMKRPSAIIFITAYDEFAVQAFEESAVDYLLKPFTRKRFDESLRKVKQQIQLKRAAQPAEQAMAILEKLQNRPEYIERIAIKTERGIAFLPCDQIDWIESEDNYIHVHSGNRTHILRESMYAIEKSLNPSQFIRIHRRFLVNADRVREMHPQRHMHLLLQNGSTLPVSRRMKEKVKFFLLKKQQ
jgi:two-component system LytT family response regulator